MMSAGSSLRRSWISCAAVATHRDALGRAEWGLFRHYWIVAKLGLTLIATVVLLLHLPNATRMARVAIDAVLSGSDHRMLRMQLVLHAAGGLAVLLAATTLSICKPFGRTRHGRRVRARAG
jgi:hypothetical protein